MRIQSNQNKGFSLIEVLIAVAIVAIIAGVAVPSYQAQVERSNLSECSSFAFTLANEIERYYTQYSTYPSSITEASGLNRASDQSESNRCTATIATVGGTCDRDNAAERCVAYTLSIARNNQPAAFSDCATLTLNNRGQKGVSSGGTVDDCWR